MRRGAGHAATRARPRPRQHGRMKVKGRAAAGAPLAPARRAPGQSQRHSVGDTLSVWKCFVLPGVGATAVFLAPKIALMVEDLPTFG
jgi:hypothetical protein